MANIQMICNNCGAAFEVTDELAGLLATCPQCRGQVAVPLSVERAARPPKLQVKQGSPVATAYRNCPSCGALAQEEAVFCVQCGYNFKTGRRYAETAARTKLIRNVLASVALLVLCGVAFMVIRSRLDSLKSGEQSAEQPRTAPMPAASATSTPAMVAAPAGEPTVATVETEGAGALSNVLEQSDIDSTLGKMAQDFKAALEAQLDKKYPRYAKGEAIALRKSNGMVQRGTLDVVTLTLVVLIQNGRHTEIPLAELDRETRLRCDPVYREKWIDAQVKKRFKDLNSF